MPKPLHEQVIVITGASSGIGRCAARHLAARGARVVVTARRAAALDGLVEEIRSRGGRARAVPGDVTREADLRSAARAAVRTFGRIDTWINNAGVYVQGRVGDITLEEYRRVLDVNLTGVINGTQRALEVMLPQGSGVIVQVSSVAGRRGVPYTSPYSAAKAGIDGFTEAVRSELHGSGVSFSTLYLPPVDTPIYRHGRGKLGVVPRPAPPVADPRDVARAIAGLAETGRRHRYFGWAGPFILLSAVSPAAADWLLHRGAAFTWTDRPAEADGLDRPPPDADSTVRDGWARPGWRGLTLRDIVRVFPRESLIGALGLGFLAARAVRRARRQSAPSASGSPGPSTSAGRLHRPPKTNSRSGFRLRSSGSAPRTA